MKSYFANFNLYEVHAVCQNKDLFAYSVDDSIVGALCIAHEHIDKDYEIVKIKRTEDNPLVLAPIERTNSYKLFYADLRGEWNGQIVYVVAGSLSIAAKLLEEYCSTYYRVEKFHEIVIPALYVSPHNPDKLEN